MINVNDSLKCALHGPFALGSTLVLTSHRQQWFVSPDGGGSGLCMGDVVVWLGVIRLGDSLNSFTSFLPKQHLSSSYPCSAVYLLKGKIMFGYSYWRHEALMKDILSYFVPL